MGILPGGFGFAALASPFFVFYMRFECRCLTVFWSGRDCDGMQPCPLRVLADIEGVEWIEEAERKEWIGKTAME